MKTKENLGLPVASLCYSPSPLRITYNQCLKSHWRIESHPWATRSLLYRLLLEMAHTSLSTGYPSEQELLLGLGDQASEWLWILGSQVTSWGWNKHINIIGLSLEKGFHNSRYSRIMFLSTTGDESCLLDINMKIGIKPWEFIYLNTSNESTVYVVHSFRWITFHY